MDHFSDFFIVLCFYESIAFGKRSIAFLKENFIFLLENNLMTQKIYNNTIRIY